MRGRKQSRLEDHAEEFRDALTGWFEKDGKDYPWRRTHDPYAVLVSEVMLQQTRIAAVLGKGYYTRFLAAFPDVRELAAAADAPLLKAWEGLGYYRRAHMLRETARAVVGKHGGVFPQEIADLMALPGIGRYTAGALRAFAFGLPAVLVDGNVARVLARLTDDATPVDTTAGMKRMWDLAAVLADDARSRPYHSGLMELGQIYCKPGKPLCDPCPVRRWCAAVSPEKLPVKAKKTIVSQVREHALWSVDGKGRILLAGEIGTRRTGLWRLPLREAEEVAGMEMLGTDAYTITRYRVEVSIHAGRAKARANEKFFAPREIAALAMAAPFRRIFERLARAAGIGV